MAGSSGGIARDGGSETSVKAGNETLGNKERRLKKEKLGRVEGSGVLRIVGPVRLRRCPI